MARRDYRLIFFNLGTLPENIWKENPALQNSALAYLHQLLSDGSLQNPSEEIRRQVAFFIEGFDRTDDEIQKILTLRDDPELEDLQIHLRHLTRRLRGILKTSIKQ